MIRALRRRPSCLLRLLMLVVVALGTAGGALASALGDLHELSHADHPAVVHGIGDGSTGHADEDTGDRILHALVHCGHCHGQGGMLPMALMNWDVLTLSVGRLQVSPDTRAPLTPRESPLRPPIHA